MTTSENVTSATCVVCGGTHADTPSLRPWQEEFAQNAVAYLRDTTMDDPVDTRTFFAAVPTGGGKTRGYLNTGVQLRRTLPGIKYMVVVVPRNLLVKQVISDWETKMMRNYEADAFGPFVRYTSKRATVLDPRTPGPRGLVVTYQALTSSGSAERLHTWAREHAGEFILVADEAHQLVGECAEGDIPGPDANKSARAFSDLSYHARAVLLMTGTPSRHDGGAITLATYTPTDEGTSRELVTNLSYSIPDFVREGYIRGVTWWAVDGNQEYRNIEGGTINENVSGKVSEGKGLSGAIKDERLYGPLALNAVRALEDQRTQYPPAKLLVACATQEHARDVTRHLRTHYPQYKTVIALSGRTEDDSDTDKGEVVLEGFKNDDADICVSVQMAYIGYDAPRIAVVCLMSNVTSSVYLAQTLGRALRVDPSVPYASNRVSTLVSLDRPFMDRFFNTYLRDEDSAEGSGVVSKLTIPLNHDVSDEEAAGARDSVSTAEEKEGEGDLVPSTPPARGAYLHRMDDVSARLCEDGTPDLPAREMGLILRYLDARRLLAGTGGGLAPDEGRIRSAWELWVIEHPGPDTTAELEQTVLRLEAALAARGLDTPSSTVQVPVNPVYRHAETVGATADTLSDDYIRLCNQWVSDQVGRMVKSYFGKNAPKEVFQYINGEIIRVAGFRASAVDSSEMADVRIDALHAIPVEAALYRACQSNRRPEWARVYSERGMTRHVDMWGTRNREATS